MASNQIEIHEKTTKYIVKKFCEMIDRRTTHGTPQNLRSIHRTPPESLASAQTHAGTLSFDMQVGVSTAKQKKT